MKIRDQVAFYIDVRRLTVAITGARTARLLAQGSFLVSRRTNSAAMKADGRHHRSDAITSLLVIVGIAIGSRFWWLDSALGVEPTVHMESGE